MNYNECHDNWPRVLATDPEEIGVDHIWEAYQGFQHFCFGRIYSRPYMIGLVHISQIALGSRIAMTNFYDYVYM